MGRGCGLKTGACTGGKGCGGWGSGRPVFGLCKVGENRSGSGGWGGAVGYRYGVMMGCGCE